MFTKITLLAAVLFLALASSSFATCAAWFKCPYQNPPGEPNTRWLSPIFEHDAIIGSGYTWVEEEVGPETLDDGDLAGAVVCLEGPTPVDSDVLAAFARASCTTLTTETEIETEFDRPKFKPFFDGTSVKFHNGTSGKQLIKRTRNLSRIKKKFRDPKINRIVERKQRR